MADTLTPEQRSYCMSRVKGKDTSIERVVRSELHRRGYRFRKHVKGLPGRPDVVFVRQRVLVFIDGDFWHGYRFPAWQERLPPFWREKISRNRRRDRRNFAKLRALGYKVIRLWEHQIKKDLDGCIGRVVAELEYYKDS